MYPQGRPVQPRSHLNFEIPKPFSYWISIYLNKVKWGWPKGTKSDDNKTKTSRGVAIQTRALQGGGADHAQHIIYCLVEGSQFGANYHNKYILEIFILHGRLFWKYGWAFVWVLYKIHFSKGLSMYIQKNFTRQIYQSVLFTVINHDNLI